MRAVLLDGVAVAVGAALGSVLRVVVQQVAGTPRGTVLVNVVGSFVLGVTVGLAVGPVAGAATGPLPALVGTGLCGGFTTFGGAMSEVVRAARDGRAARAVTRAALEVSAAVLACTLGLLLAGG